MRSFFILIMYLSFSLPLIAQQYEQSAGVRLGRTSGMTFKKFVAGEEAVEFIISGRRSGLQLTTMYLFHVPMEVSFNENFYAYYGIGGHIGFEQYDRLNKVLISVEPADFVYESRSYYVMGVDAILGIEYRWLSVPVTLGFDVKPSFTHIGMRYTSTIFWDAAINIKYVF